mgnify:CR=1 FL=1|tara:strand:+ start:1256 stop:1501 length:246 start_codon:yes stop_codon:yes gene_type:complete
MDILLSPFLQPALAHRLHQKSADHIIASALVGFFVLVTDSKRLVATNTDTFLDLACETILRWIGESGQVLSTDGPNISKGG